MGHYDNLSGDRAVRLQLLVPSADARGQALLAPPCQALWLRDKCRWKTNNFKKNFSIYHMSFFLKCF